MTKILTPEGPRWVGLYRGVVLGTDEEEPKSEHCGRLKVRVPLIHGPDVTKEKLPWAFPMFPSGGRNSGFIDIPEVGANVIVFFDGGDINSPNWLGCWFPKGKFPSRAKYSNGYRYPKVKIWRSPQAQMIRMVNGELLEIYAGNRSIEQINPDTGEKTVSEGDHKEWETYIRMDLRRRRMTVKSKYPLTVQSDAKIKVKGINVDVIANVEADNSGNRIEGLQGTDRDGLPVFSNHRGAQLVLKCVDSTGKTAGQLGLGPTGTGFQEKVNEDGSVSYFPIAVSSSIRMTPSEIRANARKVRGFKDK